MASRGRFIGAPTARRIGACLLAVAMLVTGGVRSHADIGSWLLGRQAFATIVQDARVHYEPGAEAYARAVAAALPVAIAAVEAAQGRTFREPVHITVYATNEAYRRDNGTGTARPLGVTFLNRIMLAPRLWSDGKRSGGTLELILTHELSHLHFQEHRGLVAYAGLPNWFLEGMAVMVSGGGGAERVSVDAARAAIAAGRMIRITDRTNVFGNSFDEPQPRTIAKGDEQYFFHMYYRQAGLFLAHLRSHDPAGFARLLNSLMDGKDFFASFQDGLGASPTQAWRAFVAAVKADQARR